MKYYPVYLDVRERPCVVIGGGRVAERKALSLLEAGADVTVVSPSLTPKLSELSGSGKIRHLQKLFEEKDLSGAFVVIAASGSPEVNSAVGRLCRKKNILVNVAAPPEESCFIVPSVVERGDLVIAVSTGGASPSLSRKVRQELEERYGPEYEVLLKKLAGVRKRLSEEVADEARRREALLAIVESDVIDLLKQNKTHEAESRIRELAGLKPK
ncbi:MAG TPA: bifunctional precorrin-2 dehydrogenase/sirohydrochlorin ferrochelatase [Nitrospirota bacterium]|nr:bifunctional precorrin-2 dehydrogenase/sirohydrochlorin ferrochelatase [Nitrospirota bacterium]